MRSDIAPDVVPGFTLELVVTSGGDTSDAKDGVLTLREAIADQAGAGVAAHVTFAPGVADVMLTQGELAIDGTSATAGTTLTIDGGMAGVTISQAASDGGRVLHVDGTGGITQDVALANVVIQGGTLAGGYGAGILAADATLVLTDVTVSGNSVASGDALGGGGIALVDCDTAITGGAVANNVVDGTNGPDAATGRGGGIMAVDGTLVITSTVVSDNSVTTGYQGLDATGGGVDLRGTIATLEHVMLENNAATSVSGSPANGGGIYAGAGGALTLSYATVSTNTAKTAGAAAAGGGIHTGSGTTLAVDYTTVSANAVTTSGTAYGGGIYARGGVEIAHSLVAGNTVTAPTQAAGGGICSRNAGAALAIDDSTITGNTLATTNYGSSGPIQSGPGFGGGVAVIGGTAGITSSTITANSGGPGYSVGGLDIEQAAGAAHVANSIVAGNTGGPFVDIRGTIASNGHNIFSQDGVDGQKATDILVAYAGLGALADHGGPTRTMAPGTGNPAIDGGADADVISTTDQRGTGFARISGTHTDIGAFETQQVGGIERLFTPGDDMVDLRKVDLALYPGALGTDALAGDDTVHLSTTQNLGTLFVAGRGDDIVFGSSHGDKITGSQGDDRIGGGGGDDLLYGGIGNDRLHGDGGKDTLKGSAGADTFIFTKVSDSPSGVGRDVILDFTSRQGDVLDLAKIDANAGIGGNQAFVWKGAGPLTGVGQLHYRHVGGDTIVEGNVSGSAAPEVQIELHGHLTLAAGDFLL